MTHRQKSEAERSLWKLHTLRLLTLSEIRAMIRASWVTAYLHTRGYRKKPLLIAQKLKELFFPESGSPTLW